MKFRIDNSKLEDRFLEHLGDETNSRIVLSGPFGTGKTTFLDEIRHKHSERYLFLRLAPVNYSIASNDDVFELMKFDLLIELLDNYGAEINLQPHEFSTMLTVEMFISERFKFSTLIKGLGTIGPAIEDDTPAIASLLGIAGKLNKAGTSFLAEFKKFRDAVGSPELTNINKFIEDQRKLINRYGSDTISALIAELINRAVLQKSKDNQRPKSVLIIDDLDRLDPEHIFRLFNIFSAQYDPQSGINKFGLEKVIFVCDLLNIGMIYKHRYGPEVNFTGYIDKFFSTAPFDFDNRQYIHDKTSDIIKNLPLNIVTEVYSMSLINRPILLSLLEFIFIGLVNARQINLRMLSNFPPQFFVHEEFQARSFKRRDVLEFDILILFGILKGFFHSTQGVREKLHYLAKNFNRETLFRLYSGTNTDHDLLVKILGEECFPFLVIEEISLADEEFGSRPESTIKATNHPFLFKYTKERGKIIVNSVENLDLPGELNPFYLIVATFDEIIKKHIIRQ